MSPDYSSVTLHVPANYSASNIAGIFEATQRFAGLKVSSGGVLLVTVTGQPESLLSSRVAAWSRLHLPPSSTIP
jgi:hypothetical protein